jgi:hypothetical protein
MSFISYDCKHKLIIPCLIESGHPSLGVVGHFCLKVEVFHLLCKNMCVFVFRHVKKSFRKKILLYTSRKTIYGDT